MNDLTSDPIRNRIAKLKEKRKKILALPSEKALEAILESPDSLPLVHSFPAEDFYFLIHDIGLDDSMELLAMASSTQWEYIFDQEIWEKDRVGSQALVKWFDLFLRSDAKRFVKWLDEDRLDIAELFLFNHIEIIKREHDEDPSDFSSDYFTFDDVYYIRIKDSVPDGRKEEVPGGKRERVIINLLEKIAEEDYARYQSILTEVTAVIPAETEEEVYRIKNVRLAERGFLPFEEAVGIYQPMTSGEKNMFPAKKAFSDGDETIAKGTPFYHLITMDERDFFVRILKSSPTEDISPDLQAEFATLCNTLAVADNKKIRGREELKAVVEKACGYINLGLCRISGAKNTPPPEMAREIIRQHSLSRIFRAGYGMVLDLQKQVREWKKESWMDSKGLNLSFWGEEYMGVIGGLLLKRPLFFDNYKRGVLYREFDDMTDIRETGTIISDILVMDDLLSRMAIDVGPLPDQFLTCKTLLLTLWARNWLGLSMKPVPIDMNTFRQFFTFLFSCDETGRKEGRESVVDASVKESFLTWCAEETGMTTEEISLRAGHVMESLFSEIESEYGRVSAADLDPRYGFLFLITREANDEC